MTKIVEPMEITTTYICDAEEAPSYPGDNNYPMENIVVPNCHQSGTQALSVT